MRSSGRLRSSGVGFLRPRLGRGGQESGILDAMLATSVALGERERRFGRNEGGSGVQSRPPMGEVAFGAACKAGNMTDFSQRAGKEVACP
jgi:hypothetical protein